MEPFLIFGTGRCGSTYLQRVISLSTPWWIWGEHDGFLRPLMQALAQFEESAALSIHVFDTANMGGINFEQAMVTGGGNLAWINGFHKQALRNELRDVLDRMFRFGLPDGWREWGFKEILYGNGDDTPLRLMALFPASRAAFTFREPRETLASMMAAWNPILLQNGRKAELEESYSKLASRWKNVISYFIKAKEAAQDRLIFLSTQQMAEKTPVEILRMTGLPYKEPTSGISGSRVNSVGQAQIERALSELDTLFERHKIELNDLYSKAIALT